MLPPQYSTTAVHFAVITVVLLTMSSRACLAEDAPTEVSSPDTEVALATEPDYETVTLRGQVVWLVEALQRRFGIQSDDDPAEGMVALETKDGQLYPIVEDARGRGFHKDERIRNIDVALRVRQFVGSPVVQVIRVYTIHDGKVYEFDYWCDICSIPMFELKECECCQGPTRFRERLRESAAP